MIFTAKEFIEKMILAEKQNTHYIMGCFGAPMNKSNKQRYIREYAYNKKHEAEINKLSENTFGFDCVCFIKGILWGWNADTTKEYGGAKYKANNVPDVSTEGMLALCSDVSTDFSKIVPGELVHMTGHVGIYIGDGKVIECTPKWTNNVQYSNLGNLGYKTGHYRTWTKHGKLPWIDYAASADKQKQEPVPAAPEPVIVPSNESIKVDPAKSIQKEKSGRYRVCVKAGAVLRTGAGTSKKKITVMPYNAEIMHYGYYTKPLLDKYRWLLVQYGNQTGFVREDLVVRK